MPEHLQEYCYGCLRKTAPGEQVCPVCGWEHGGGNAKQPAFALPCGTLLHAGKYLVGRVLGQGGFGITYVGLDLTLELKVAIKEFYPTGSVSRPSGTTTMEWHTTEELREAGRQGFVKEARKMAKIRAIPNVVSVREIFYENETAYIVMDFVEGETLHDRLMKTGVMAPADCLNLLRPAMEALGRAHRMGMIHRDISPDNIMIDTEGWLWLLDLGAAKEISMGEDEKSQSSVPVMRRGFSPPEQAGETGKSGPWTDVYAMCATFYYCVTGKVPPDAINRLMGKQIEMPETIPPRVASVLLHGLALQPDERFRSMEELMAALDRAMKPRTQPAPEPEAEPELKSAMEQKTIGITRPSVEQETVNRTQTSVKQAPIQNTQPSSEPAPEIVLVDRHKQSLSAAIAGITTVVLVALIVLLGRSGLFWNRNNETQISDAPATDIPVAATPAGDNGVQTVDKSVYAVLYADGEMVFQNGDKTEAGRNVTAVYSVDDKYPSWHNIREQIQLVSFADKVSPQSTARWFYECKNLKEIRNIENLETSNVTDMSYMFYSCSGLTQLDVTGFNTTNVTDMSYMFYSCSGLTQLDVTGFNTTNVTKMWRMFRGCSGLTQLDVSSFNTANVNDMTNMFNFCDKLMTIYVSGRFHTEAVKYSSNMFLGCTSLVGGAGTRYDEAHTDAEYARIDGGTAAPGYFTAKG